VISIWRPSRYSPAYSVVKVAYFYHLTVFFVKLFFQFIIVEMSERSSQETQKILQDTIPVKSYNRRYRKNDQKKVRKKNMIKKERRGCSGCGCLTILFILTVLIYFLFPLPNRFLLLGIDRSPPGTMTGRSDTIMVFSVNPLLPVVKVLSIPRDLWVSIPGVGENRINTAHFFAEAQETGAGPGAAIRTINQNFQFRLRHYIRFNLENFPALIDSLDGISLTLSQPMSGYPAGTYQLNGTQALAFVRSRSDGDDFFRIRQGQVFLTGFIRKLLTPETWPRLPLFFAALPGAMDTNIPFWLLPRIGLALARASFTGIETLVIDRSMLTGFTTFEGAQVLLPDWPKILEFINLNW